MKRAFPQFGWKVTRRGGVEWCGVLQPTQESPGYRVRILHEPGRAPRAWVDAPQVKHDAPHRYPEDQSLCLYWHRDWNWAPDESLADTIIPWTAFWLYFYEVWLVTGEWLGPSSPHQPGTRKEVA